jgi:hypothetical protein
MLARTPWNATDLTGQKFNKLTVISKAESKYNGHSKMSMWLCRCECGQTKIVAGCSLRSKNTKSCGKCPNRKAHNRKGHGEISGAYWANLRHGAESRKIEMSITEKQAWDLFLQQERKCAISGVELIFASNYMKGGAAIQTASLDRIDRRKGYIIGNVRWVHKHINMMKNVLSDEEFIGWCKIVVEHAGQSSTSSR